MDLHRFALRLDQNSLQTGETSLKEIEESGGPVTFQLSKLPEGTTGELDLVTSKNGALTSHLVSISFNQGVASGTLQDTDLSLVLADAHDGDWDYIEARWELDPNGSTTAAQFHLLHNATPYDLFGWPPNK